MRDVFGWKQELLIPICAKSHRYWHKYDPYQPMKKLAA